MLRFKTGCTDLRVGCDVDLRTNDAVLGCNLDPTVMATLFTVIFFKVVLLIEFKRNCLFDKTVISNCRELRCQCRSLLQCRNVKIVSNYTGKEPFK